MDEMWVRYECEAANMKCYQIWDIERYDAVEYIQVGRGRCWCQQPSYESITDYIHIIYV